ncbi:double-cubane-cluster-containing anaerobic reductase [Tissierella praeacuta]|uniref:double-cubane-cluster-containing anaerobic reductase n=1 Tax=Tissierella praeacuta TaxID=43131 RepID=UPI003341F360
MDFTQMLNEFAEARQNGFITTKELKDEGKKVIGVYCGFAPWEIITASGAIAAWLCGMSAETIPYAEKHLPANLCPLIKSSYGFAVEDKCPYFYFSDMLIGETTCDGKKKMYEFLGDFKPMHIMHLPQNPKASDSFRYYRSEMVKLKEAIEKELNVEITDEKIRERIKIRNKERKALREFYELGKLTPPPIYGFDLRRVLQATLFIADKEKEIERIEKLTNDIKEDYEKNGSKVPTTAKRILVTGSPLGDATENIIKIIEENGGVVVCFEMCSSIKDKEDKVDEEGDPIDALTERYLKSGCACMSPNDHRMNMISNYIDEYKIDGVIDITLQSCHTYNMEGNRVKTTVNAKNRPYLHLETDYSQETIGQLTTRISAFLEML